MEEDHREDADVSSRVNISAEQLEGLIQFIEAHPTLARGKSKPLHVSQSLWAQCAEKLNGYKDGCRKNSRQWAKCWTDMKYRVRRRTLEIQAAKASSNPVSEKVLPLSSLEERMLAVIGHEDVAEVVIKSDPLDWEEYGKTTCGDKNESNDHVNEKTSSRVLRRTSRARKTRAQTSRSSPECSSPPDKKVKSDLREAIDSDSEDSASAFLELEKRKLESADRLTDAVLSIRDQMARMTEAMMEIKDYFVNKHNNL